MTSQKNTLRYILSLSLFLIGLNVSAQDIEKSLQDAKNIIHEDPVKMTGSINASTVFYQSFGIPPRRDPFYWVLNANLTFVLFNKVTVPFSATFTQQDKNFTNGLDKFSQPFNQFGISPKYKWLTVHAGYRTMNFSDYTYSGTMFLGGGVEINPEKSLVSGSAFFGRLVKAVPVGGVSGVVVSIPAYERWGGGGKVKLGTLNNFGELIFFKARDSKTSIPFDTSLKVLPAENQVIGLTTKQKLNNFVTAEGSFSYSMYTNNLYEDVTKIERFTYINKIYAPRSSSQFNKAMVFAINFTPEKFKFGFKYKRIDPDYKTMGAIFLTNDIEEYSANTNFSLYKNKINLSTSAGFQQNNLDKIQAFTSKRIIGSVNGTYNVTPSLNINLNYSNFSSNTIAIRNAFNDSIKLVQLTQSGSFNANYAFGKEKTKHTFNFSSTYQESGGNKQATTKFGNGNLSYCLMLVKVQLNVNAGVLYNQTINAANTNQAVGPTLGLQKSFLNRKLRCSINSSYQVAQLNQKTINKNLIGNLSINYAINKINSFKLDANYLQKQAEVIGAQNFSEYRITIGYLCNFSASSKKIFKKG